MLLLTPEYLSELVIILCIPAILDLSLNICLVFLNPELLPMDSDRAFSVCAPTLWNELPFQLRMSSNLQAFKLELKTIFFIFRWAFALLFCILLCIFFCFLFFVV